MKIDPDAFESGMSDQEDAVEAAEQELKDAKAVVKEKAEFLAAALDRLRAMARRDREPTLFD